MSKKIPSFWNYSRADAATNLADWFNKNKHSARVEIFPSGNAMVTMEDYEWTLEYSNDFDNNSPFGWLLEPYDEHSVIFTKEL